MMSLSTIPPILLFMMLMCVQHSYGEVVDTERRVIDLVFEKDVNTNKDELVLGFSKTFAVQQTELDAHGNCSIIDKALQTRKRGNFLLYVTNVLNITCDMRNMCKQNFGIKVEHPSNGNQIRYHFGCKVGLTGLSTAENLEKFIEKVEKRQRLFTPSSIPEEYVGQQSHEGRLQLAIMTMMALVIVALMGVLVMTSINHTKEKKKVFEKEQARKAGKSSNSANAPLLKSSVQSPSKKQQSDKSVKGDASMKSIKTAAPGEASKRAETADKSAKSEQSAKIDKSVKSET